MITETWPVAAPFLKMFGVSLGGALVVTAIARGVLLLQEKKSEMPDEVKKFKSLYSRIRHCQLLLEHGRFSRDTASREIKELIPHLEEIGIKTPSPTHSTVLIWKDYLDQLLCFAGDEVSMDKLENARKIYFSKEENNFP